MDGHAGRPADESRRGTRRAPTVAEADLVARVSARGEAKQEGSGALTSARVVVGAGRGAGGPDGFGGVIELAELLDGALGVSRVVTSLGWRPHHEQVGQTGSRISPELYVPCGISGAIQHWAGCSQLEDHPGDQHRRRGADGDQGALRRHRRHARGRAGDRRRAPAPGRLSGQ